MTKQEKIQKFINEAQEFIGKRKTASDSKFEAWNNALLRFIKNNYDNETYNQFKSRYYSLSVITMSTPDSEFIKALEDGVRTTIEDLKYLLEEEKEICDNNISQSIKSDYMQLLMNIFEKFHLIVRTLRNRYNSRPTLDINDEYDVHDLLHALLCLYFDDIRPEEWTPSYAGSCSRQDFLLKKEKIVIEVKKTRQGLSDKQIGEQLIIDINRYKSHQDCKYLLCFVYDPEERIVNPKGLENDLTKVTDGLNVITKIVQK